MQHIETVTVGSGGAASITFSAIPDNFTDLVLMTSLKTTRTNFADQQLLSLNGSALNFTTRHLFGDGASVGSFATGRDSDYAVGTIATATNTFSNAQLYFPNYRSNAFKSYSVDNVTENNATNAHQFIIAGLWSDTSPITSITLVPSGANTYLEFSSASLYGITAGSDGIVAVS